MTDDAQLVSLDEVQPEQRRISQRIQQLNSLVQHEVAELLLRHMEWPNGALVTVSKVSVAEDAESAKVWLSVLPATKAEDVLRMVNGRIREIQTLLNKKLVMKFVPKLTFVIDRSEEKAETIESILDRLEHESV